MEMKNKGGPAFPVESGDLYGTDGYQTGPHTWQFTGMTQRDYFAAAALNGIEASQGNSGNFVSTVGKVAARAVELADALLAELAK